MKELNLKKKFKVFSKVNWLKTLYFNFKKFPISEAIKLPIYFYGKVNFKNIDGKIIILTPIKSGMIGFGQPYEMASKEIGTAELVLSGSIIFMGHVQFGKDYFIYVKENAVLKMGHMSSLASNGKIICTNSIQLGNYARIGSESQVIDTNFHQMIDVISQKKLPISSPIIIGNFNFISNRVTILSKTITPDYCTIASNSLCSKNYSNFGNNILIGGIPAKLLKNNISRDWVGEKKDMDLWLKI